jgi:hypothetical protein
MVDEAAEGSSIVEVAAEEEFSTADEATADGDAALLQTAFSASLTPILFIASACFARNSLHVLTSRNPLSICSLQLTSSQFSFIIAICTVCATNFSPVGLLACQLAVA